MSWALLMSREQAGKVCQLQYFHIQAWSRAMRLCERTWSSESSQIWTMSRSRGQSKAATWSIATCVSHRITFSKIMAAAGRQPAQLAAIHSPEAHAFEGLSLDKVVKQGMRC